MEWQGLVAQALLLVLELAIVPVLAYAVTKAKQWLDAKVKSVRINEAMDRLVDAVRLGVLEAQQVLVEDAKKALADQVISPEEKTALLDKAKQQAIAFARKIGAEALDELRGLLGLDSVGAEEMVATMVEAEVASQKKWRSLAS